LLRYLSDCHRIIILLLQPISLSHGVSHMSPARLTSRSFSSVRWLMLITSALLLVRPMSASAPAAPALVDQVHSLKIVPASAAFYSANLRLREQWDALASSKAYARLMEIPFVQAGISYLQYQFEQSPEPPFWPTMADFHRNTPTKPVGPTGFTRHRGIKCSAAIAA